MTKIYVQKNLVKNKQERGQKPLGREKQISKGEMVQLFKLLKLDLKFTLKMRKIR